MDPFSLLSPEAMEELFVLHPFFFLIWSAITFCSGVIVGWQVGKRLAGIPTFYDLTKRQRFILANIRNGTDRLYAPDGDVIQLKTLGMIADANGYDIQAGNSPHDLILTAKGNRMLNFHPIGRRISARSDT